MSEPTTDLDEVMRVVMHAAHRAAIDARVRGEVNAAITHHAVHEALRCGVANGLIQLTPRDTWPDWLAVDPPYEPADWTRS